MNIVAVRGAVSLEEAPDEETLMIEALGRLFTTLADLNDFSIDEIVSVQMTQTSDLNLKNAAAALRAAIPEYGRAPLFCSQEPNIKGSLPRTIRVLITWRGTGPVTPVYLGAAQSLRPDLALGE
jgi:chorismate mutase